MKNYKRYLLKNAAKSLKSNFSSEKIKYFQNLMNFHSSRSLSPIKP